MEISPCAEKIAPTVLSESMVMVTVVSMPCRRYPPRRYVAACFCPRPKKGTHPGKRIFH